MGREAFPATRAFSVSQVEIKTSGLTRADHAISMEAPMRNVVILLTVLGVAPPAFADDAGARQLIMRQPARGSLSHPVVYARLGYGATFADLFRTGPAVGFGFRGETESFALDVSFANFVINGHSYDSGGTRLAGSFLRLEVLHFLDGGADRSMYAGGGLSLGAAFGGESTSTYTSDWTGSGLQGEVTVGYEFGRKSPLRLFVQGDVGIPFFIARSETYAMSAGRVIDWDSRTVEKRYAPSAVISMGIGWKRRR